MKTIWLTTIPAIMMFGMGIFSLVLALVLSFQTFLMFKDKSINAIAGLGMSILSFTLTYFTFYMAYLTFIGQ